MANAAHTSPGALRPGFTRLPDGRGRLVVRAEKLSHGVEFRAELLLAKGTLFSAAERVDCSIPRLAHLAALRLVDDGTAQLGEGWYFVRTYEDIDVTAETLAGRARVLRGDDGRVTVEQDWLQFSSARATPQKPGTTSCPVWPVALTGITGVAATDVLTLTQHGLLAGDPMRFTALAGGAGLDTVTTYYVVNPTADTFQLSATVGGAALDFTTDITAATLLLQIVLVVAQEQAPDDGTLRRITRRYVSDGLIAIGERSRGGGLKEVTWTSVQTKLTPAGVVIADNTQNPLGVRVHTVTAVQSAAGTSPEAVTYSYGSQRRWQAPGRLKAQILEKTVLTPGEIPTSYTFKTMALNKASPVIFEALPVTVSITYQTSNAVGTVSPAQWDPQKWCTVDADIILGSPGPRPLRKVQDVAGYAVDDGSGVSAISLTATSGVGPAAFVFGEGEILFQGDNVHKLTVTGPVYPAGEARTIEPVRLEEDFQALDGTKWYKRTQVSATLPTLPAMPTLST